MEEIKNTTEELEKKTSNVIIDSTTGEHKILSTEEATDVNKDEEFEKIVQISSAEEDTTPITKEDVEACDDSEDMMNQNNLSKEAITGLLDVANKRIKKEKFNIYAELPEEVKSLIDNYVDSMSKEFSDHDKTTIKKHVAEGLVDDFITKVKVNKAKTDFATELDKLYSEANKDISQSGIELVEERNKEYRKIAEKMSDEAKKEKLLTILDQIDEARALTTLKEFASKNKIKHFQLEKPKKTYNDFLNKYKNSTNNIYNIELAWNVLVRKLDNPQDADIFLISFCNQVRLYDVKDMVKHAYMYYVLYYCATLDGDVTDTFINNIKEVVANARKRNNL